MKITESKLRRLIRRVIAEHVTDEHHEHGRGSHVKEPYEGYAQEGANMYVQDEDYDGYIKLSLIHI